MSFAGSSRLRLLAGAALVLTFVAGGLGGAAVERVKSARSPSAPVAQQPQRDSDCPPVRDPNRRRRTPYDDLGLTADQQTAVDSVLHSQGSKMDVLSRSARARQDSIFDQTRTLIRQILTPEQGQEMDHRRAAWMQRDSVRREERRQRCAAQAAQQGQQDQSQQGTTQPGRGDRGSPGRSRIP
jgi:hypothetical protein